MLLYFSVNITRNKKVFVLSILLFLIICSIPNNPGIVSLKYREIPIPGLYKLVPNLQPYNQPPFHANIFKYSNILQEQRFRV